MTYRTQAPNVLLLGGNGHIVARDYASGRLLWQVTLPGSSQPDVPLAAYALTRVAVAGDLALAFGIELRRSEGIFGSMVPVHVLVALELTTGALRWRTVLYEGEQACPPGPLLVHEGSAIVSNAYITASFELASGRILWAEKNPVLGGVSEGFSSACGVGLAVAGNAVQADSMGWK